MTKFLLMSFVNVSLKLNIIDFVSVMKSHNYISVRNDTIIFILMVVFDLKKVKSLSLISRKRKKIKIWNLA